MNIMNKTIIIIFLIFKGIVAQEVFIGTSKNSYDFYKFDYKNLSIEIQNNVNNSILTPRVKFLLNNFYSISGLYYMEKDVKSNRIEITTQKFNGYGLGQSFEFEKYIKFRINLTRFLIYNKGKMDFYNLPITAYWEGKINIDNLNILISKRIVNNISLFCLFDYKEYYGVSKLVKNNIFVGLIFGE